MTLKILKLDRWMQVDTQDMDHYPECELVFNRDGQYYDTRTKKCWFEFNGTAREISRESFLFTLKLLNHRPLRNAELAAIEVLVQHKLANKMLRDLLQTDSFVRELKQTSQKAVLYRNRFLKRLRNEEIKIN